MRRSRLVAFLIASAGFAAACGGDGGPRTGGRCRSAGEPGATSQCRTATLEPSYYVEQSETYFDTLDSSVSPFVQPSYSPLVARWEWPPWLLLTGYTDESLILTDIALKLFPTRIAEIECRFFDVQPFGRCHMVFDYEGLPCPIYEEFTFNDAGQMTFIEAWSDFVPFLPTDDPDDRWAEGADVHRLSTEVPGLGNADGLIDLGAPWMEEAASTDADVAEFVRRARDPWATWIAEVVRNVGTDLQGVGCIPPTAS
ncbi:MAG: hypothetical protein IPK07_00765 [Deltaproteobacteria bacterium]|jgi:hypothetical protein|nr:hypothetical protein [Deltaproteobacteria bacterium]